MLKRRFGSQQQFASAARMDQPGRERGTDRIVGRVDLGYQADQGVGLLVLAYVSFVLISIG